MLRTIEPQKDCKICYGVGSYIPSDHQSKGMPMPMPCPCTFDRTESDICQECKGKGWWATYVAPGDNWVYCTYCLGTGIVRPMVACELCDDTGKLFRSFSNGVNKLQTCYLCYGKKVIIKPLEVGESVKSPHDNPADLEKLNKEYPLPAEPVRDEPLSG